MIRTAAHLATLPEGEHKHVTIRTAVPGAGDFAFLDHLQKKYSEQVGFLPRAALEQKIARGQVSLALENDEPAGYLLGQGNYQRDPHFGIICQAAVSYDARRRLLGTALVQHFIEHMEPGVRLVGLWCAQDIEANEFWSACGFEALAARHGSRRRGRVHIFWVGRAPGMGKGHGRDAHATGACATGACATGACATGRRPVPPIRLPKATHGGLMRARRQVYGIAPGEEYKDVVLPPEEVREGTQARGLCHRPRAPRSEPKASLSEQQRAFRYGQAKFICVVIAGVTRYLPAAPFDVPELVWARAA